ncbi:MAG: mechanosensitive ion channel family protein [Ignavibacteria bacterium]|nr:MAG: mechanosensitive ion channel family protein [Ignavibacteria bacterium]
MELKEKLIDIIEHPLFVINNTPVTLVSLAIGIFIIVFFVFLSRILKTRLLKKILTKFNIETGVQFMLTRIAQYIIITIGVVVAFQTVGIDLSGLAVVLGFLSVGIGFGLQNITSNFIAGLILLFERPINVGDRITVGDREGDVTNINIRSTTIKSIRNISIIVPNSEFISSQVINWSHGDRKIAVDVEVGVSYNSDLDLVKKALLEVAADNNEVLTKPRPEVFFVSFGDSAWNMKLRVWINDPKRHYNVLSDLNSDIVRKFRNYNIEIPFPQRDLHILKTPDK